MPSPNNDISRSHVRFGIDGWLVQVTDLGSTNGTLVTVPGQQPVRLRPHDPFTILAGHDGQPRRRGDGAVRGGRMSFTYSNLPPRRGRFVTWAGRVYPGVARVQGDVEPFAAAWARANAAALADRGDRPLWVALGDSLTQGIGAGAYDRGWVGQLRDRLTADGRELRAGQSRRQRRQNR